MSKYAVALLASAVLAADPLSVARSDDLDSTSRKLKQAFSDIEMANAAIKLDLRSKGLLIVASKVSIEADGRVKLTDCGIARFGEGLARPTSVRAAHAYLALDGPVRSVTDLVAREILGVELAGGVLMEFGGE